VTLLVNTFSRNESEEAISRSAGGSHPLAIAEGWEIKSAAKALTNKK